MFPQLYYMGETMIKAFTCAMERDIILQGKMILTAKNICFYTNVFNRSFHIAIPFKEITQIEKRNTLGFVPNAIRIIQGEVHHSFISFLKRDLAFDLMIEFWENAKRSVIYLIHL